MRIFFLALWLALAGLTPAAAQLSFGFSSGGVSIGVNVPVYPRLVRVPGYPVYYAPGLNTNYFFYDGLYWVFQDGEWYESSWYNGPWSLVPPDAVPLYVLRVPVRYYRRPPTFFHGWAVNAPPRWDEHWGSSWADQHRDWNRWDRKRAPAPAPLPSYQRRYSGNSYPRTEEQAWQHERNYRYQPRDNIVREHYQRRPEPQRQQQQQTQRQQQRQVPQHPQPQQQRQQQQQQQREQQQRDDKRSGGGDRDPSVRYGSGG